MLLKFACKVTNKRAKNQIYLSISSKYSVSLTIRRNIVWMSRRIFYSEGIKVGLKEAVFLHQLL